MSKQDLIWAISIDIGKKNFAFYIEEFDLTSLLSLKNIPKAERYNPNGTPTIKMEQLLRKIYKNGRTVIYKNSDLTENCTPGSYLDPETYYNMTDLLDSHRTYLDKCSYIIIEQQVSFRGKYNTMALKLGQHCYSYFSFMYSRFKNIIEFPAYHKTQVLGAQKIEKKTKTGKITYKVIDKPQRKKWSVVKAKEIFVERGDKEQLEILTKARKADDLADVVTQLNSWKYLMFVDKSI